MNRRDFLLAGCAITAAATLAPASLAMAADGDGAVKALPAPEKTAGQPVMACLDARKSSHKLKGEDLSDQELSNVLWAAFGVSANGKHTVPTAMNRRLLEVYAVLSDGVWLYMPKENAIKRVLMGDLRSSFDGAPCVLLYAAPVEEKFSPMHIGSAYQNVGLYCASAGLQNCVKYQKHDALNDRLPLGDGWTVMITQSLAK